MLCNFVIIKLIMKTLNLFFLTFILSLYIIESEAQIRLGLEAGINVSNVNRNLIPKEADIDPYKPITGFQCGVKLKYKFREKNQISIGIGYAQRGGRDLSIDDPFIGPYNNRSDFVQFPLIYERTCLFKHFRLGFGLINSYELFRQTRIINDDLSSERKYGIDVQVLTSYSFSPALAVNLDFLYGSLLDHITLTEDLTHSVLSLSLSYNFKLRK